MYYRICPLCSALIRSTSSLPAHQNSMKCKRLIATKQKAVNHPYKEMIYAREVEELRIKIKYQNSKNRRNRKVKRISDTDYIRKYEPKLIECICGHRYFNGRSKVEHMRSELHKAYLRSLKHLGYGDKEFEFT
jgi:hypothetical protein